MYILHESDMMGRRVGWTIFDFIALQESIQANWRKIYNMVDRLAVIFLKSCNLHINKDVIV